MSVWKPCLAIALGLAKQLCESFIHPSISTLVHALSATWNCVHGRHPTTSDAAPLAAEIDMLMIGLVMQPLRFHANQLP